MDSDPNLKFIPHAPMITLGPMSQKVDPFLQKLLDKHKSDITDQQEELGMKQQKPEEKDPSCALEAYGNGDTPQEKSIENKFKCLRCDTYINDEELESHKTSHSSEILDWLYLGGLRNANNLKELTTRTNISYILNAACEVQNYFPDQFQYLKLDMEDTLDFDIHTYFDRASDFLELVRVNGGRAFVHCQQGISRSASLVIAYLISKQNMTLKDAYELVKAKRSLIRPNNNFLKQLARYELKLRGQITLDLTKFGIEQDEIKAILEESEAE